MLCIPLVQISKRLMSCLQGSSLKSSRYIQVSSRIGTFFLLYIRLFFPRIPCCEGNTFYSYTWFWPSSILCSSSNFKMQNFPFFLILSLFLAENFMYVVQKDLIGIARKNQYALLTSTSPRIPVLMPLIKFDSFWTKEIFEELQDGIGLMIPKISILPKIMAYWINASWATWKEW